MQLNVLLVDDENGIIQALRRMLRAEPYQLFEASDGEEALEIIQREDIHLMVTDYKMPRRDGISLCEEVRRLSPATYRLLLSGQVDYKALQQAWKDGVVHRFVAKPWDNYTLTMHIHEGLRQHALLQRLELMQQAIVADQAMLLTDDNWIVRLANPALCRALDCRESDLLGVNLFSASLSTIAITLEAEVTRQLDAGQVWLGYFNLLNQNHDQVPSWMAISPLGKRYRLCALNLVNEHDLNHADPALAVSSYHNTNSRKDQSGTSNSESLVNADTTSLGAEETSIAPVAQLEFRALPVFNAQGGLVALESHQLGNYSKTEWDSWFSQLVNTWDTCFTETLNVIVDASGLAPSCTDHFLAALNNARQQIPIQCSVILDEDYLISDEPSAQAWQAQLQEHGCKRLISHFGRSFLNARQILNLPIDGISLAPEFLTNIQDAKRGAAGIRMLQKLHEHGVLIYARNIHQSEALAATHKANIDWLSGAVMSHELHLNQLHWYGPDSQLG
ncbi:MAG: response regulator [Thalassolituus sp.]|uniref:response regulator n=1 Tax=Thalassolituus sp. TaxID=2030822 RepID=UPI0039826EAB